MLPKKRKINKSLSSPQHDQIPREIVKEISSYLSIADFKTFRSLCRFFAANSDLSQRLQNNVRHIKQILCKNDLSLLVYQNGTVLAWGLYAEQYKDYFRFRRPWEDTLIHRTNKPTSIFKFNQVEQFDIGKSHLLLLKTDGTVQSWGSNGDGQLGISRTHDSTMHAYNPIAILDLKNIGQVAVGDFFSLALQTDGTVWGWGENEYGQLSNMNGLDKTGSPYHIPGLDSVDKIAAGTEYSLFLKKDGTIWGCGNNHHNQLGLGLDNKIIREITPILGLTNIKQMVATTTDSFFLKKDGTVWVCNSDHPFPTQISNINEVKFIAANHYCLVVIKKDGSAWKIHLCRDWQAKKNFTPIRELKNIREVSIGNHHFACLKQDHTVWVSGDNQYGQLGLGDEEKRNCFVANPFINAAVFHLEEHRKFWNAP